MKSKATGCGSISAVFSNIALLCISSMMIIIIIIIIIITTTIIIITTAITFFLNFDFFICHYTVKI